MSYDENDLEMQGQSQGQNESQDVLRRNIEGSRRITEAKRQASAVAGGPEPRPHDAEREQAVPPGQADVPAGGSSGSEQNLGGGYKSESRH